MEIQHFFDPATSTLTYVVHDPTTRDAVLIDPVLDFDPASGQTSTESVGRVGAFLRATGLRLHYVLETHAHADHLSGSQFLRRTFQAQVAIGARITEVQRTFKEVFDLPELAIDGSQFDRLLADGDVLRAGSLTVEALATPGHTPACMTYRIGDAIFTGDALFIEDQGTGRCDFPRGSADDLYTSVHERLYPLPDTTRVFVGHDYQPNGRLLRYQTTIGAEKRGNLQLAATTSRAEFVRFRTEHDATLTAPRLLLPSIQINIDAGQMPAVHANGKRYLTIPLELFGTRDETGARSG